MTKIKSTILAVIYLFFFSGFATADCGGSTNRKQPMLTLLQKLRANSASCGGASNVKSCSGSAITRGCSGSVVKSCGGSSTSKGCSGSVTSCSGKVTSINCAGSTQAVTSARPQPQFATPVRSAMSNVYQQALASAQYRAANRIHGHSYLDTHRTSGVGWASNNPSPNTCLGGDNHATYAVVRGADGWYATKFQ